MPLPFSEFNRYDLNIINLEVDNCHKDNRIYIPNFPSVRIIRDYENNLAGLEYKDHLTRDASINENNYGDPDIVIQIRPDFEISINSRVYNEQQRLSVHNVVAQYLRKNGFI